MQIDLIKSDKCAKLPSSCSFKSTGRCVFNRDKQIICNYTKFFRDDLNWKNFVKLLSDKYKNVKNVNILNLACSDGSEPLSLMSILIHRLGSEADKFFPIKASDADPRIISDAMSGIYNINGDDLFRINMTLGHYSDYFSMTDSSKLSFPYALKILPKYSENVIFNQMDMVDAIEFLEPQNNVIMCRNALPYLKDNKDETFIDKLAEKVDSTSLLVIGAYDNGHNIPNLVRSRGFKPYELENVYCKY